MRISPAEANTSSGADFLALADDIVDEVNLSSWLKTLPARGAIRLGFGDGFTNNDIFAAIHRRAPRALHIFQAGQVLRAP